MSQFLKKVSYLVVTVMSLTILSSCGKADSSNGDAMLLLALQPGSGSGTPTSGSKPTIVGSPAAVTTTRGTVVASTSASSAATQAAGITPMAMQAELMASMAQIKAAAQPAATSSWNNQQIDLPTSSVTCNYWPNVSTMQEMSTSGLPTAQGSLAFASGSKIIMNGTYAITTSGTPPNTTGTVDADYTTNATYTVNFTNCGITAIDLSRLAAWDGKLWTIPMISLVIHGDVTFQGTSAQKQYMSSTYSDDGTIQSSILSGNSQFSSEFESTSTSMKVANTPAGIGSAMASNSALTGSGSGTQIQNTRSVINKNTMEILEYSMLIDWNTTETVTGSANGENVQITIPMRIYLNCSNAIACML